MTKILIQQLVNDKPLFDRSPRCSREAIEMVLPPECECLVIHKVSANTVNIYCIQKDFPDEVIIL